MSKDSVIDRSRRQARAVRVAAAEKRLYTLGMRHVCLSLLLAAGCASAVAGGPAVRYAGEPFDLEQRPGRISGQVCGMDVNLDVQERPGDVRLTGFVDGQFSVELRAHDEADGRHLDGRIGASAGDSVVDLKLTPTTLSGRVGFRHFELGATNADTLAGTMRIAGAQDPSDATVAGRSRLAALSPAVQAALLPTLLQCNVQRVGQWGRSSLLVRVGGPAGALPHQSSALYTHD
jgi:hypothetical protein